MDLTLIGMVENKEVRHPLREGEHLIGRADDAALKLVQPSVSRRHAQITISGNVATVQDLGSHNGTLLNGAKVADPLPIKVGDVIEVANLTFRVEGPGGAGAGRSAGRTYRYFEGQPLYAFGHGLSERWLDFSRRATGSTPELMVSIRSRCRARSSRRATTCLRTSVGCSPRT